MVNQEFFEEVRKKDDNDIVNHFGPSVGRLLIKHAILEEKFNTVCVEDGVKMTKFEEMESEEARQCALDIRQTTAKLVRLFSDKENRLKLRAQFAQTSAEFSNFIGTVNSLEKMMNTKLNTPQEEVKSIEENKKILEQKTKTLQETLNHKLDAYHKYCEECSKSKELRKVQIDQLRTQINNEKASRQEQIIEANEEEAKQEQVLKQNHEQTVAQLEKSKAQLKRELDVVRFENEKDEQGFMKDFKKVSQDFDNNMKAYDAEVQSNTYDYQKCLNEYNDTNKELQQYNEEYKMRMEEKRKRDEIETLMRLKNEEQNAQRLKLERASEYLQAHWRGLIARREMEKQRKGKKKKKKKK
uniref:Dynein regulatory complex protein 10 n=1 Tax=Strombidium rassoulzadegani TaxID=1082188 RepID=A0A7S3CT80_9SPIT|mmetsp:Transcript_812/g.1447  ORF Transcript_812/g.1447 Transcript_812/m.1447 type:complete len:355 (+) Transcript_812:87-1151(+)